MLFTDILKDKKCFHTMLSGRKSSMYDFTIISLAMESFILKYNAVIISARFLTYFSTFLDFSNFLSVTV